MYDRVKISADALTVTASNSIQRFKEYFVWILILLCSLFSVVILKNIDSQLKYFIILPFPALIAYYKFVYLRLSKLNSDDNAQKLSVSASRIDYFNGMYTYIIPLTGVAEIEDHARYHDFQGRNERGWNHTFTIKLRDDCSVLRVSASNEAGLTSHDISEIQVFNLVLKHSDYEAVLRYILKLLSSR